MGKSLVELLEDMESARLATIKEGQRNNAIVKKIFSSVGTDAWPENRENLLNGLNSIYRHMDWGKSMGHGIFSAEFFKEIPELYESLPPAKQQEIDGVFLEQPDIRERIKQMEWTVLDFLKSEAEG